MPQTKNRAVMIWLYVFSAVVAFLVIFGGYVRLTRSGLSIVEWNPVSGVFPPIGERAWQEEFAKYQLTPEYQQVNMGMTLQGYQQIFYIEWLHRLIARLAGFFYAIPVFYFLVKGTIPRREFGAYFIIGLLFISQALMGWLMVASGLVDRPAVSHFRLTIHLLFALSLLALSLWVALGHHFGFPPAGRRAPWSRLSALGAAGLAVLLAQITYGGLTAGLKAGHVSDTWPLMFGDLVPAGLFRSAANLIESPLTIVFIHRWFAFVALAALLWLAYRARRLNAGKDILRGLALLTGLGVVQITLGVMVVLLRVQIWLALSHQATAVALFALAVYFIHRFRALDFARAREG
jgi:cytochrome c oxidase assembly protein subunit 15